MKDCILEIGPGDFGRLRELAGKYPGSRIYALSPEYRKAPDLSGSILEGVIFVCGTTDHLFQFKDGFFSRVEAHYVFTSPDFMRRLLGRDKHSKPEMWSAVHRALMQMDRILEPGGTLLVSGQFRTKEFAGVEACILSFLGQRGYEKKLPDRHCPGVGLHFSRKGEHRLIIARKPKH